MNSESDEETTFRESGFKIDFWTFVFEWRLIDLIKCNVTYFEAINAARDYVYSRSTYFN